MRYLMSVLAAGLLALTVPASTVPAFAQAAESAFVDGFDDLPLMPGLAQDGGSTTVFDSPYGRIAEASAHGRTTRAEVLAFYRAALPQLGWQPRASGTWQREGEVLSIEVSPAAGGVIARFQVSPAG